MVSTPEMIYSNFSFPKHFKQYLKIRNSQTLKTYLLCGCRPPLWWIEISIANTEFWSLPISLYIQCILKTLIGHKIPKSNEWVWLVKKTNIKWVVSIGQKRPRSNSDGWVWLVKKTKIKFKWVGLIGEKDPLLDRGDHIKFWPREYSKSRRRTLSLLISQLICYTFII